MGKNVDKSTDFRPRRTHDLRRAHALVSAVGIYLPLPTLAEAFVVQAEDDKARLGFGPSKLRAALAVELSDKEVEIRDARSDVLGFGKGDPDMWWRGLSAREREMRVEVFQKRF